MVPCAPCITRLQHPQRAPRPQARRRKRKHVPHHQRPQEFVSKRNTRERRRIHGVNRAFDVLRQHIPLIRCDDKTSKISILRHASNYIMGLASLLKEQASHLGMVERFAAFPGQLQHLSHTVDHVEPFVSRDNARGGDVYEGSSCVNIGSCGENDTERQSCLYTSNSEPKAKVNLDDHNIMAANFMVQNSVSNMVHQKGQHLELTFAHSVTAAAPSDDCTFSCLGADDVTARCRNPCLASNYNFLTSPGSAAKSSFTGTQVTGIPQRQLAVVTSQEKNISPAPYAPHHSLPLHSPDLSFRDFHSVTSPCSLVTSTTCNTTSNSQTTSATCWSMNGSCTSYPAQNDITQHDLTSSQLREPLPWQAGNGIY